MVYGEVTVKLGTDAAFAVHWSITEIRELIGVILSVIAVLVAYAGKAIGF